MKQLILHNKQKHIMIVFKGHTFEDLLSKATFKLAGEKDCSIRFNGSRELSVINTDCMHWLGYSVGSSLDNIPSSFLFLGVYFTLDIQTYSHGIDI